jgi:hypothetical protein
MDPAYATPMRSLIAWEKETDYKQVALAVPQAHRVALQANVWFGLVQRPS